MAVLPQYFVAEVALAFVRILLRRNRRIIIIQEYEKQEQEVQRSIMRRAMRQRT